MERVRTGSGSDRVKRSTRNRCGTEPRAVASGIRTQAAWYKASTERIEELSLYPARYRSRFCTALREYVGWAQASRFGTDEYIRGNIESGALFLRSTLGSRDLTARYAGDEFVILIENVTLCQAEPLGRPSENHSVL
jgi:hypothetical protein